LLICICNLGENRIGNHLQTVVNDLVSVLSELEQGDFQSRWETAKQIPNFGESAIASLIDLLHKTPTDLELQWFVARILGQFDHADAVIALVHLLQSTDDDDIAEIAAQMLAQIGPQAVDALAPLLQDPQSRTLVVPALAQMQDAAIVPLLLSVVTDADVTVRITAIETLGRFHDPRIVPALRQGLIDLNAKVRRVAIMSMSYRSQLFTEQGQDPVALIAPLLNDLDLQVCQTAALALGRLATDAAAQALQTVASADLVPVPLKLTIVQALGQIGNHQSVQFLQKLWPHTTSSFQVFDDADQMVAEAIIKALTLNRQTAIQVASVQALIHCLHHQPSPDLTLNKTIASALGQLGDTEAIPDLIRLLGIPDMGVRLHAIAALKQIAPELSYIRLQALSEDDTVVEDVREGVAIALREW